MESLTISSHQPRVALLWLAIAALPFSASAQWNATYTLCAPQYSGVPFTYLPPAVDGTFVTNFQGNVDNDTGWTGAFRYVMWNGTALPDGAFQIIQDSSTKHIYLSFQMKHDPTFDTEDSIVLGFDPDNLVLGDGITHPNMQRIIIHPVVGGVGATDPAGKLAAGQIEYWKGWVKGTGWQNEQTDPALVTAVARSAGVAGDYSWDVQIRIDNSVLGLPASPKPFGIYVNLVRVDSNSVTDTQFTWPASTPLKVLIPGDEVVLEGDSLPDPSAFGTGSLNTACSGVNISTSDITGSHGGTISLNQPNQFSVLMHNSGSQTANKVFATFQIANYGLPTPDDWARPGEVFSNLITQDPLPNDATQAGVTIGSGGGTATLSTGMWTPGGNIGPTGVSEHDYYQATPDTCIRVILSSNAPDTIFSVRSSWNNFETGNTSEFKHTATIGTKGYRLPDKAKQHQFILQVAHEYTPACVDPGIIVKHPDMRYSHFKEFIHGCRVDGVHVTIKHKKFADCADVGSFGYDLRHEGPVSGFTDHLTADGIGKGNVANSYVLMVNPGTQAKLTTTVVSHPIGCGQTNKKQGGTGAVGVLLLGLFTFVQTRQRRG